MKQEFKEIPLNEITVVSNYRETFDETGLKELAASIKENGVIEPIILRPHKKGYAIIAGERRFRAAQIAGLAEIPAVVREVKDDEILKLQLIENVQRQNVPFMEEAYGIQRLRDELSLDIEELCKIMGKSNTWIYQMLQLTRMHSEAQRFARNGFLTKPVAMLISRLPLEEDQSKAANALARTQKGKQVDIRFARRYIEDKIERSGLRGPRTNKNAIQKANGNDYCANWKKYLVNFTSQQFEFWKTIVRGRTDVTTLSEAVEKVMLESSVGSAARNGKG